MLLTHALRAATPKGPASVTLVGGTFLQDQTTNTTQTLTFSGHQVGDMLVALTSTRISTIPTLLTGYTDIVGRGVFFVSVGRSFRIQYKIATSTSETITWTGSNGYLLALRNATTVGVSNSIAIASTSTTCALPTLNSLNTSGSGLILAGHYLVTTSISSFPSPYVLLNLNSTNLSQLIHTNNTQSSLSGSIVYSSSTFPLGFAVEFLP